MNIQILTRGMLTNICGSHGGQDSRCSASTIAKYACRGFTLLEVMVSLSIIAIALLAVYGNYSHTIAMNTDQQFNTIAPQLAARVAADFENRSLDDLADESGNFGPAFAGYAWAVAVESFTSEILGNIAEDLHIIDISVSLNDTEKVFRCRSVRFIRRESDS